MLLLIGIILMFQTFLSVKELEPIHFPNEGATRSEFTLVSISTPPQLLVVQGSGDGKIRIFDKQGGLVFQAVTPTFSWNTFQRENTFYFFSQNLYRLDLATFKVDSIPLSRTDYEHVRLGKIGDRDILLTNYSGGVHIYDLATLSLIHAVLRDENQIWDKPRVFGNSLIFKNKRNELQAYDLSLRKVLWRFNSGTHVAYFVGIKVGTFQDFFLHYVVVTERNDEFVVATSVSGSIFKLHIADGQVVLKRERFKGTGNNAGLIGHFILIDMNGDDIQDIVGGSVDYNVYCINGKDFSVLWEYNTGYENQMPCSFADVNGDGTPDVFSVNDEYRLTVLDGRTGKLIHEMIVQEGVKKGWNQTQVLLADLTENGRLNVVVKGGWNRLRVFEIPSVSVPKNEIVWIPEQ